MLSTHSASFAYGHDTKFFIVFWIYPVSSLLNQLGIITQAAPLLPATTLGILADFFFPSSYLDVSSSLCSVPHSHPYIFRVGSDACALGFPFDISGSYACSCQLPVALSRLLRPSSPVIARRIHHVHSSRFDPMADYAARLRFASIDVCPACS